jgi:two-component system, cell cycle sensor histidine kinase and response regulator CckA
VQDYLSIFILLIFVLGIGALAWQNKYLKKSLSLYQETPESLVFTTLQGRILFFNKAFEQNFSFIKDATHIQSIAEYVLDPKSKSFFIHNRFLVHSEPFSRKQVLSYVQLQIHDAIESFTVKKDLCQNQNLLWRFAKVEQQNVVPFEDFIQAFEDHSLPVVFVSDEGQILNVNRSFSKWLGHSNEKLRYKKDFLSLFFDPPSSWGDLQKRIFYLQDAQGHLNPASVSYSTTIQSLKVSAFFLAPADVTYPIHRLDDQSFLDILPLPGALLDERGTITCLNDLCKQKIPGIRSKNIPIGQWVEHSDIHVVLKTLKSIQQNGSLPHPVSLQLKASVMTRVLAFLKYFPPHHEQSSGQFLMIFQEMNENSLASSKNSDSQRLQLLGQLASGIVHDFNNLLTGVIGFCDLLLQRHTPGDPSYNDISQIRESAFRATRLIQQLLSFSKQTQPFFKSLDVVSVIEGLSVLIRRLMGPKIILNVEKEGSIPPVWGDVGQLEQIILNLAVNARDAMPEGGHLTFKIHCDRILSAKELLKGHLIPQKYTVIHVSDTGTGIPADKVSRIFDPFFSTKDPGQGTGLGLATVLSIAEQFQGAIDLKTLVGKGTTFSLYLPEHHEVQDLTKKIEKEVIAPPKEILQAGLTILLAEDETPIRLFTARALRSKGYKVLEAKDGLSALEFLKSDPSIELLVTDVMMPGMDGPELVRELMKMNKPRKILFVSGYPEDEIREQLFQEAHNVYFLAKPFNLNEFVDKVGEIVNRPLIAA